MYIKYLKLEWAQVRSAMGAATAGSPAVLAYTAGQPNAYLAGTAACRCRLTSPHRGIK